MKNKILFKDLSVKGKEIIWNSKKNEDGTYRVDIVFDHKKEIVFNHVPGQYVAEDGEFEKKQLDEKESEQLIDRRMQSLMARIQQAIFTVRFYGGEIEGSLKSGLETDEKKDS